MEGSRLAMKASSLGRAARSAAKIKVRQPLGRVLVKTRGLWEWPLLEPLLPQVMEELNVKAVEPLQDEATLGQGDRFSVAEEAGYVVAVDTLLSLELQAEGAAREVVHQLQNMRRNAGFDISDRIYTCYRGDAGLEEMVEKYADYIRQETLSVELIKGQDTEGGYSRSHKVQGKEIQLTVRRA
jgi:isoleucyl-tRNA synthetase